VKDAFLAEIRKNKVVFYNTVVAQAQKIEVADDRVTFTFLPNQRTLRDAFDEKRSWLESIAQQATGRKIAVAAVQGSAVQGSAGASPQADSRAAAADEQTPAAAPQPSDPDAAKKKSALREQAMADASVQAMLEIFPAEIRDVEEM
jgi:hypothetical protein